jgi:hypothetical protein
MRDLNYFVEAVIYSEGARMSKLEELSREACGCSLCVGIKPYFSKCENADKLKAFALAFGETVLERAAQEVDAYVVGDEKGIVDAVREINLGEL